MKKIIHYEFKKAEFLNTLIEKNPRYLCNWAVKPSIDKLSRKQAEVTCKNCLHIIKKWNFKDEDD